MGRRNWRAQEGTVAAYTLSTVHAGLSGSGSIAIAQPVGLKVAVSNIPAFLGHDGAAVVDYFDLGRIALGNADGTLPDLFLRHPSGLFYPVPDSMTQLSYDLVAGAQMSVTELVAAAAPAPKPMPWDRNISMISSQANYLANGPTQDTIAWSYTVPAGRILKVAKLTAQLTRYQVASTPSYATGFILIQGAYAALAVASGNDVGRTVRDQVDAEGLYLPAGYSVVAHFSNAETGGVWWVTLGILGTLFDA